MKAYVIMDGGGVKGAALAGCLQAAADHNIEFEGYGGTSAGSIVALLACVGYQGDELREIMTEQIEFSQFLDDHGTALRAFLAFINGESSRWSIGLRLIKNNKWLRDLRSSYGLYHARKLEEFLLNMVKGKLPGLQHSKDVTFHDLCSQRCPLLKILASDLSLYSAKVYSNAGGSEINDSVITAVRSSMSYPFVFRPVPRSNEQFIVDGGLSSNLPAFLFEKERRVNHLPVIAFDLVTTEATPSRQGTFLQFCRDMLFTALESNEHIMRQTLGDGVYYVDIPIPNEIGTLDFSIPSEQREQLYNIGYEAASTFFNRSLPQWGQARDIIEQLQARHAPAPLVEHILQVVVKEIERYTPATNVRAYVMLPTDRDTLITAYHYGMDGDPDVTLEFSRHAGYWGIALENRVPSYANLDPVADFADSNLTQEQQPKIRGDRRTALAVPIFDIGPATLGTLSMRDLRVIGIMCIDTDIPLPATLWTHQDHARIVLNTLKVWADILSRVLG